MPPRLLLLLLSCAVLLVACSHGNIKRVSEPAVSLQQVSVASDGHWTVELRLQNYSTVSMMYDAVDLQVTVGGQRRIHCVGRLTARNLGAAHAVGIVAEERRIDHPSSVCGPRCTDSGARRARG